MDRPRPVVCSTAKHDGVCDLCGDMIAADVDVIVHLEEDNCWVHRKCAEEEGYECQ